MDSACNIAAKFRAMGARVKLREDTALHDRDRDRLRPYELDVRRDRKGPFFDLVVNPKLVEQVCVMDCRARDRHLLLLIREVPVDSGGKALHRFLCGHDERDWFAAAILERRGASNVREAMEALKPAAVRSSQRRHKVKPKDLNRRLNAGFLRQGEWFFLPRPELVVDELAVLRDEPLRRGGGKPHMAEYAYRCGGTLVYANSRYPEGLAQTAYEQLLKLVPKAKSWRWQTLVRDPKVFVKGRIRHPDHQTLVLPFWHRVVPNTESKAAAKRHLVFLD